MVETNANISMQPQPVHEHSRLREIASRVALVGALAFGGASLAAESAVAATPTAIEAAAHNSGEFCKGGFHPNANIENRIYGSSESLYPALNTTDNKGNTSLVSKQEASTRLEKQVCNGTLPLAGISAILELRDNMQLPSSATPDRIVQLNSLYQNNKKAAEQAAKKATAALSSSFLEPTTTFAVTKGQATQIVTERANTKKDKRSPVEALTSQTVTSTGNFLGFELGFNKDDKSLTAEQRALLTKLQSLILINQDGTIVINQLIGEGSVKVDTKQAETSAKPNKTNNKNQNQSGSGNQNANAGGGTFGTTNGQGESNQPGNVSERGGNGGFIPGQAPSFGPGGGAPGTTTPPETAPPVTQPPVTTRPPVTTVPPPPTTTTPPPPPTTKGPAPCDPNIAAC